MYDLRRRNRPLEGSTSGRKLRNQTGPAYNGEKVFLMNRRDFLKVLSASMSIPALSGCGLLRIDPDSVYLRSDLIDSPEKERAVRSKGSIEWTDDGRIRVVYVEGTPYERGYQHGALLRREIQDNIGYLYEKALAKYPVEEL